MTQEERDFIVGQFKSLNEKIDLVIDPVRGDVDELKVTAKDHAGRIITLENFKEGHQQSHNDDEGRRRFSWEIIVSVLGGSGIIGVVLMKALSGLSRPV